ncbi:MAG: hypothetical protein KAR33_07330 [Candidatus Thorarchaeota archaeon]|nr:hypothetical protein [Candidatus Thorarchaeota archaeon]
MIRSGLETTFANVIGPETGREVDPFTDSEIIRLVALNLELAVRNLVGSATPPECIVLTADICTHRLVAMPTSDGDVSVLVFEA